MHRLEGQDDRGMSPPRAAWRKRLCYVNVLRAESVVLDVKNGGRSSVYIVVVVSTEGTHGVLQLTNRS